MTGRTRLCRSTVRKGLPFPGNFRGYASNSRHSLQKDLDVTYGKASLTALGGGKPQRESL
jgi:hypothetical protein